MHEGVPVSQAWLRSFVAPRHKSRFDQPFNIETQLLRRTSDHFPHQRGGEFSADDGSDLCGSFGRAQKVQAAVEARLQGRWQGDCAPRAKPVGRNRSPSALFDDVFRHLLKKKGDSVCRIHDPQDRGLLQTGGGGMADQSRACFSI
jgi:hypothetical protein